MKKIIVLASFFVLIGCMLFTMTGCVKDWNFATLFSGKYVEKTTNVTGDFNCIDIVSDTLDIKFVPTTDGSCKVVSFGKAKVDYIVNTTDGVLKIELNDSRKWYEKMFNLGIGTLTVYLPEGAYTSLFVEEDTGNISVPKEFSFDTINIKRSTGDVSLYASASGDISIDGSTGHTTVENISCGSLEIKCSTGNVYLRGITASADITIDTSTGDAVLADIVCANIDTNGDTGDIAVDNLDATASASFTRSTGDVNINNVKTGGDLNIAVSTGESTLTNVSCTSFITVGDTGDVLMSKLIATGKIDIVRSTGDVDFEDCDAAEIRIQTSTGNVKGNWLTEKVFIVRSNTGKISVPETTSGGKCKIETDTGDIVISIEK